MEELSIISSAAKGGGIPIAIAIVYFLKQIKTAISAMEKNFQEMNSNLQNLNNTMIKVVTERDSDRKEIDRLRDDIKELYNLTNQK